jgi:hypothetical protein
MGKTQNLSSGFLVLSLYRAIAAALPLLAQAGLGYPLATPGLADFQAGKSKGMFQN